jgi:hypothetical protein
MWSVQHTHERTGIGVSECTSNALAELYCMLNGSVTLKTVDAGTSIRMYACIFNLISSVALDIMCALLYTHNRSGSHKDGREPAHKHEEYIAAQQH